MFKFKKYYDANIDQGGTSEEQEKEQKEEIMDLLDIPSTPETKDEEQVEEVVDEVQDEEAEEEEATDEEEEEITTEKDKGEDEEVVEETTEEGTTEETEETEEVAEEEEVVDTKDDKLLSEIARLTEQLNAVKGGVEEEGKDEKKDELSPEIKKQEEVLELSRKPVDLDEQEYLSSDDFRESLTKEEVGKFNEVLNKVVAKVREETRKQTIQDAMSIFPGMIDFKVQGAIAAKEFWDRNPAMTKLVDTNPKMRSLITWKAQEVQREHSDWTLGQVYKETEREVKELLGERLTKFEKTLELDPNKAKKKKPALIRKPGKSRKPIVPKKKGEADTTQDEIMELLDFDV